MWILFVSTIVGVSAGLALASQLQKWKWGLILCAIATLECALVGSPDPSWSTKHVLSLWFFGIIMPWALVALCVFVMPYPRRATLTAVAASLVYFVSLGIGLMVGDATGLVPQ